MSDSVATTPLLDLLASPAGEQGTDRALAERAGQLMEFALAEYDRIAGLDENLGRLALRHTDRQGAAAIRRLYQQWVEQADELLHRVRTHGLRERLADGYEKLERAVGRTLAMLSVTLDSLERADEQIQKGEVVSAEEIRRELRARSPA